MPYHHRLATREDLPAIVEIYNWAVLSRSSTCDLDPVSVASRQAWFDRADPTQRPIWVSHEQGSPRTVTGYLSFEPFLNGRRGYDVTSDLAIYLHPDHRARGQGGYLLREAIRHAPKLGVRTLATTILAGNESSTQLFRSCGFQEWGRLPRVADLEGAIYDVIVVGRTVGNSYA